MVLEGFPKLLSLSFGVRIYPVVGLTFVNKGLNMAGTNFGHFKI